MDNLSLFFLIFGLSNQYQLLDYLMIFGARYVILLTFLIIFVLVFKGSIKERKAFLLTILAIPVAVVIIKIIHLFIFEPRPFVTYHFTPLFSYDPDASFPSRHASIMSVIAFAYTYFKSKWAILFLTFMIWIGISRIYVGVHYPLDILGGVLVGATSIVISKQIIRLLFRRLFPS